MLEGNAVGGDEDAGTVFAKFAVDENFLNGSFAEERKKPGELPGSRSRETADRNRNEMHSERFGAKTFLLAQRGRFAAQVNDRGNAKFFQFAEIGKMRLGATKKGIGNLSSVGNAVEKEFFSDGRRRRKGKIGPVPK